MTSVEFTNEEQFNLIRDRLSSEMGRQISDTEVIDIVLQFGTENIERLSNVLKVQYNDKGFSEAQFQKALTYIVDDVEITDVSQNIDEVLYG